MGCLYINSPLFLVKTLDKSLIQIKGNKKLNISKAEIIALIKSYEKVVIDFGTGDGRFVYKNALKHPTHFLIGVDPSAKQLEIYARKAIRKKLENTLFVVGSLENRIPELEKIADVLYINLPWGSLLQAIVKPDQEMIANIAYYLKNQGEIKILLGYSQDLEPSESDRLQLPEIDETHILNTVLPVFEIQGFILQSFEKLENINLKTFETTWSKKLHLTKDRPIYYIQLRRQ